MILYKIVVGLMQEDLIPFRIERDPVRRRSLRSIGHILLLRETISEETAIYPVHRPTNTPRVTTDYLGSAIRKRFHICQRKHPLLVSFLFIHDGEMIVGRPHVHHAPGHQKTQGQTENEGLLFEFCEPQCGQKRDDQQKRVPRPGEQRMSGQEVDRSWRDPFGLEKHVDLIKERRLLDAPWNIRQSNGHRLHETLPLRVTTKFIAVRACACARYGAMLAILDAPDDIKGIAVHVGRDIQLDDGILRLKIGGQHKRRRFLCARWYWKAHR